MDEVNYGLPLLMQHVKELLLCDYEAGTVIIPDKEVYGYFFGHGGSTSNFRRAVEKKFISSRIDALNAIQKGFYLDGE